MKKVSLLICAVALLTAIGCKQAPNKMSHDEMLAAIPSDIPYYAGPVGYYVDKALYRIQVKKKED